MYSALFDSFVKTCKNENTKNQNNDLREKQENVDYMHMLLNEIKDESYNSLIENKKSNSNVTLVNRSKSEKLSNGFGLGRSYDDTKSFNSGVLNLPVEDPTVKNIFTQIESLQCLFTWKLKSRKGKDLVTHIKKKYGDDNLDISVPEFTFVRFIGNLIISYELYQNGESDASDMKILEIGNWLEELDKGTDQFYLSINTALKHIRMANFIHKLLTENETGGFKLLFNEIVLFEKMNNKSKAAVHAIRAAMLIEYGINPDCYTNACKYAKIAFELDSETSLWFHIYVLALTTQREFLCSHQLHTIEKQLLWINELCLIENEINLAIQQAIMSSNVDSTCSLNSLMLTVLNQFTKNEFQMLLSGLSGFKTVHSQDMNGQNIVSVLEEDIKIIIEKHKNGADVIPYLMLLVPKYNQQNKWKVIAQICSYTILFTNNLRFGAELFLMLIEESDISMSDLVINHCSLFINKLKIFNLAELIWNEITMIIKCLTDSSLDNILFFYKMFFKIKETYNLKTKIVDPYMRVKLIGDLPARFKYSNIMHQNDTSSFNNVSFIDKSKNILNYRTGQYIQMQTKIEQYAMVSNQLTNSQQFNLYKITTQDKNTYFKQNNTNFKSFELQSSKAIPSLVDLKPNVTFESSIYTNNISSTNITSNLINIDTSLSIFPRGSTSQVTYKACLNEILKSYPHSFRIYTDASKIQNNVGIAIVSDKDTYTYKLSSEYTSCDAEAVAILRALDYALVEHFKHYIILSDSLSTITCIQNQNISSSDVINSILCLMHAHQLKGNLLHLVWIPSHNAIGGNEIADRLAKQIAISTTAITYSHNSFMTLNMKSKFFQT